jgi:mono/diheme cytochrome c family protein
VTVTTLLVVALARSRPVEASVQDRPAATAVAANIDPKPLYAKHCEPCHGRDGKAPVPEMGFIAREWKHGTSTADIVKTIAAGVPATAMLPFKGKLKEPELIALARYVRSLDPRLAPEKGGGSD